MHGYPFCICMFFICFHWGQGNLSWFLLRMWNMGQFPLCFGSMWSTSIFPISSFSNNCKKRNRKKGLYFEMVRLNLWYRQVTFPFCQSLIIEYLQPDLLFFFKLHMLWLDEKLEEQKSEDINHPWKHTKLSTSKLTHRLCSRKEDDLLRRLRIFCNVKL